MPEAAKVNRVTVDEYLENELRSQTRHEFVDGHLFAQTGASRRHDLVAANLVDALRKPLAGRPALRVYSNLMKVHVEDANAFYYPDVSVADGASDLEPAYLTEPLLLAEVISPETETTDRREKLIAYRRLPSLREYLLVEQPRLEASLYRRDVSGQWWEVIYRRGDAVALESVGLALPLMHLYAGTGL